MGQILHGSARTTAAVRRAIQHSQESLKALSERHGINEKTVLKWKKRDFVHDAPMGPKDPRSTVLTKEEEAVVVAFRRYTLLALDDCLYALQPTIPHLTRSNLHRCLQRHGISRLPEVEGDKSAKKKFKTYPIGYFHIDIAEVQTEEGKLYLFVAIDRTSKFAYAELHERATRLIAKAFLENLLKAVPYKIHTILTDNGIQFTKREGTEQGEIIPFERVCLTHDIDHRMTKIKHPWTNGQVERMNRTLKEATVKKYYYQTHDHLKTHMQGFLMAYNFARRLKTLKGLTPYEYICKIWTKEPERFNIDPFQHTAGLNT
jgi:transposase InsO family protein